MTTVCCFQWPRGGHDALPGRIGIIHFDAHLDLMDESENRAATASPAACVVHLN
ncbi:arginase family protein [Pseudomonas sp. LTJR-52]|uniref:arginase family protein n=1 Tax=Pseudomonas sp. LTJR-52 TaxID=2479392 RepID=UPI001C498C9B